MSRIIWPELEFGYIDRPRDWVFRKVVARRESSQLARIAAGERGFLSRSVLRWLLDADAVTEQLLGPDLAAYGLFAGRRLSGFVLVRALQADLVAEAAFCCIHPDFRDQGVATEITSGIALACDQTEARLMYGDAVTHHAKAQQVFERAGFIPVGFLPEFEVFGTSGGDRSQSLSLVRYVRFPRGNAGPWLERIRSAQLTPRNKNLLHMIVMACDPTSGAGHLVPLADPLRKAG